VSQVRIKLVTLGNLKVPVNFLDLERWKSSLFVICHRNEVGHLPDAVGPNWQYSDNQLSSMLMATNSADMTLGIINAPLDGNFYLRRVATNVAVLSLFEMAEIIRASHLRLEHFILRNVYELITMFAESNGKLDPRSLTLAHDEIRGCLYDMNSNKSDIVFSMNPPSLCVRCRTRILDKQVDSGLLPSLDSELKRIRKDLFFRISDWVKEHPVATLWITLSTGLVVNILASLIYDTAKSIFVR
jgi:hypothetical protein